jgi:hypothetical protein
MKFSRVYSRVKMRRFSYVLGPNSVPIVGVWWWFGRTTTSRVISFGSAKPPAHPEDGDGVSSRNVGKPSHLYVAVCPRKFHCMLYVVWWWSIGTKICSLLHRKYIVVWRWFISNQSFKYSGMSTIKLLGLFLQLLISNGLNEDYS